MKRVGRVPRATCRRTSLRGHLLRSLLIPMLVALALDAVLTYAVALAYANHVHDRSLADDDITLAQLIKHEPPQSRLTAQAQFLLEYDPTGREYFAIYSAQLGWIAGSQHLSANPLHATMGQPPTLYRTRLDHTALRAATVAMADPQRPGDTLYVTVAENLIARHRQARQILLLTVPLQVLLTIVLLLLVRMGVRRGLGAISPLTRQLARRERSLTPLDTADVPIELLPLARTIDVLLGRLHRLMDLHERFIADAAHQLRTPLTGLSMHVERALAHTSVADLDDALMQIGHLTARASRTANQLLALTRAQSPDALDAPAEDFDLTQLVRSTIEPRLHQAWRDGIDLGYEGPSAPITISGNAAAVQELIDNLLDNALHYAGRKGMVTLGLDVANDAGVCLSVDDSGPGVDPALFQRLGERFFRAPNTHGDGSGLGLAIVKHIAERHAARVAFRRSQQFGGLRVEIHFPPTGAV